MTLYLQTPYKPIRDLTGKLLNQTLSDSFMFTHDPEEVQLWLNALPKNFSNDSAMSTTQQAVLQFVDTCIGRFSKAQYKYTDQLVELVSSVNTEHANTSSLATTFITQDFNTTASNYKHPFSPLLLTLCENLNFIKTDRRPAILYLTRLITSLLTTQSIPFYLERVCAKLDSQIDADYQTSAYETEEWTKNELIHQAKLCIGQEKITTNTDVMTESALEDQFTTLINTQVTDNLLEYKERFIALLEQLPVAVLEGHLEKTAIFCSRQLHLVQYEPLAEYMTLRHPLACSIFAYTDIKPMKHLISMEQ